MSILNSFLGLGKFIFSIKKMATIKTRITISSFIIVLIMELPRLGRLLYLSCIVLEFI